MTLPLHICSVGRFNAVANAIITGSNASIAGDTWPANDRALYYPLRMPERFTVARFMIANSTNLTGNVDIGLYNAAGGLLVSTGSTLRAGSAVCQFIGITDRLFPAGSYFIALLASSTTGTFQSAPVDVLREIQACGVLQEDVGATALPATMNPAAYATASAFYFGFTQSDTL